MLANAEQALERLRHKQTGEILPSKIIDRNTRLVYLDDQAVGLRFYDTFIAKYLHDGVLIDTRDRHNQRGWFTVTTWQRIGDWTPARTFSRDGLRHIVVDPAAGWDSAKLYTHGTLVYPDGSCEIPMDPATSDAIAHVKRTWPAKLKRYAEKVVALWRDWEMPRECCHDALLDGATGYSAHLADHVRRNDYAVPHGFEEDIARLFRNRFEGDALAAKVAEHYTKTLREALIPVAIHALDPNFPFPQS